MMRFLIPLAIALLFATSPAIAADGDDGATFVVVRHAEKAAGTGSDPDLSAVGRERAQALAQTFVDRHLAAIYTTDFLRTRRTVQPSADAQGLQVTIYDARQPVESFATQLKAAHRQGVVLVAGHSNTIPGIVSALCACAAADMPDSEYDRLSIVHIAADGSARLQTRRFGGPAPAP